MNVPSEDIKDMLEAESSLGLTFATNLFIGKEPSSPDDCVTIFDTFGSPPQLTLDNQKYENPSIQIRVRSVDYKTGWNLIADIVDVLHGQAQKTWNTTLYSVIYATNSPALLDWDDNDRCRFIVNFNIQRR